ncbi:MAG: DUF434 domain-containing protein [Candidatus Hydrogenedentes bacterium]|nr:DUF434 domain-containing protein [Candidatus Hydrogenedentota bacterium]
MGLQRHRGKHPEDEELFSPKHYERLKKAVEDLSYLFSRGYSEKIAIKVVGDHYQLTERQRIAVQRASCGDNSLRHRKEKEVLDDGDVRDNIILIDGYNLLITVESLISGGVLLRGRDGCVRDIASIHGTYHKVEETVPALRWIGTHIRLYAPREVRWFLDTPVSNSRRLAGLMREVAEANGWNWSVEVVNNPDRILVDEQGVVITSDSWILDRVSKWLNFVYRGIMIDGGRISLLDFSEDFLKN